MSWTTDYLLPVVIGIASSIVSSFIFLLAISRVRPRLQISEQISRASRGGTTSYAVKVINRGRRPVINIKARLSIVRPVQVAGGTIISTQHVPLVVDGPMVLPGYKRRDKDAEFAFRFRTTEDLESIWAQEPGSYVRFRMIATDSLSGFSRVVEQRYSDTSHTIVAGSFGFGRSMSIHPLVSGTTIAPSTQSEASQ